MVSKITGGETELLFTGRILGKFDINYYQCKDTGFIQTEEPYWLDEAYSSVITKLDVGLVQRNLVLSKSVGKVILKHFEKSGRFLDYAGGYGLFTRIMRDKGFDFYHTDKFCKNIFAEYFDLSDINVEKFEAVTAFEVFEHLVNPIQEIKEIFKLTNNLFFSTELQPKQSLKSINNWWYFSSETGQHISFYNEKSLQAIADRLQCNYYTDNHFLHLFTKQKMTDNPFDFEREPFIIRKIRKKLKAYDSRNCLESLLQRDWQYVKDLL